MIVLTRYPVGRPLAGSFLTCLALSFLAAPVGQASAAEGRKVDFNREIRPILSDACFACHGPDEAKRKAKLRFDVKESAFGKLPSGNVAIVAGKLDESELLARITSKDPEEVMPPPKSGKKLSPAQIQSMKAWVQQGASWSSHWAYETPKKATLPTVNRSAWPRNPIDRFILAGLETEGLNPSVEADKSALIRRVTFDLTGLPPTPREVDDFLTDNTPDAYERLIDRLLKSPRFGEHFARQWLDVARYGDTHGLHLDNYREIWPYREWVINAYNKNMPFDRFLTEQLAGDLMPGSTLDQQVATGFIRCNVTTSEGGSIEEEVYVRNVVDQVDTFGTVFLGLTIGCARCHDHKFDPPRARDYYSLFAFFNNLDGSPLDGNAAAHPPVVKVPNSEQATLLAKLDAEIGSIRKTISSEVGKVKYDPAVDENEGEYVRREDYVWIDDAPPAGAKVQGISGSSIAWPAVSGPEHPVFSGKTSNVQTSKNETTQFLAIDAYPQLIVGQDDVLFTYVFIDPINPPKEIMLQWNSDEWRHRAYWGQNLIQFGADGTSQRYRVGELPTSGKWVRLEVEAAKVGIRPGAKLKGWAFTQHGGTVHWDQSGIETFTPQPGQSFDTLSAWVRSRRASKGEGLPKDVQAIVNLDRSKRSAEQGKKLVEYFVEHGYSKTRQVLAPLFDRLAKFEKDRAETDAKIPTTLVFRERPGTLKTAFILNRGEYDQKRDQVTRAVPAFLPPLPPGASVDRLGLAKWLLAPNHPLTARVAVNRYWQQLFGAGLVKTSEDFGSQGEPPSHPELLDWLAVEYRESGWNTKALIKNILTSASYRQAATYTPEKLKKDPSNRLVSRGPRFRLDAETLRDQALFVSGLLVEKQGGPSVRVPQPAGIWEAVAYTGSNTARFTADAGHEKVHRRSMYTFWKRTAAPPQMTILDAPTRENCTARRERTNTPLQALMLLNEPQFVEAARGLAERSLREGGESLEAKLRFMFKAVTSRAPDAREFGELASLYRDQLDAFKKDGEAAKQLISVGESKPAASPAAELAAMTVVANALLNLDEVLNKG